MGSRAFRKVSILKHICSFSWRYWLSLAFITLSIFYLFRFLNVIDQQEKENAIEGLLRSEYLNADSYALSKALTDLETLNFIKCALLIENFENPRTFYDTTHNKYCSNHLLEKALTTTSSFQAINGLRYTLRYQKPIEWQVISLEVFSYLAGIALVTFYFIRLNSIKQENNLKMQALTIEKELLEGQARQIHHDVSSPLSAFRIIVKSAKGLDDTVKSVLIKAVERTEKIFSTLNERTPHGSTQLDGVEINHIISDLLKEKSIIWPSSIKVHFLRNGPLIGFCNTLSFQRILSNILNNSFEAIPSGTSGSITVRTWANDGFLFIQIIDTGIGIPEEVKSKVGMKGFSFGKESIDSSGSGLGIYSAQHTLSSWGGNLMIESTFGKGTTVTIKIRAA